MLAKQCEGCPRIDWDTCEVYLDPMAFVRGTGQFMCPIHGYARTSEKKGNAGHVRVGQQKQKSFKQTIMGRK